MAAAALSRCLCWLMQVFSGLQAECVDGAVNHFHGSGSEWEHAAKPVPPLGVEYAGCSNLT